MIVDLNRAAEILRGGGLVAFPTETVYGLGADGLSEAAVARIFEAKGRPPDNPLILHVEGINREIAAWTPLAERLAAEFWPGPLTLVLERRPNVPAIVSAGLDTVAIRSPRHPIARRLLKLTGRPIAAPSANLSGRPSPTTAEHVREDFPDLPIIDGGPCEIGLESTVVEARGDVPIVLRFGSVVFDSATLAGAKESPGTRHAHYKPRCEVIAFEGEPPQGGEIVRFTGDFEEYARNLYARFRDADARGIKRLYVELPPDVGLGRAIRNRILMAAAP